MNRTIRLGGILIIASVFGIFIFIISQVLPLFYGAKVGLVSEIPASGLSHSVMGMDERGDWILVAHATGKLEFYSSAAKEGKKIERTISWPENQEPVSIAYSQNTGKLFFGTNNGQVAVVETDWRAEGGPLPGKPDFRDVNCQGCVVEKLVVSEHDDKALLVMVQKSKERKTVHAQIFGRQSGLLGGGELKIIADQDLTEFLTSDGVMAEPVHMALSGRTDGFALADKNGSVWYFTSSDDEVKLHQVFEPFHGRLDPSLSALDFIFGGTSLLVVSSQGQSELFSLYIEEGEKIRKFGRTKVFDDLPGPATFFAGSRRNKSFVVGADAFLSLRYSTTAATRWEEPQKFKPLSGTINGKNTHLAVMGDDNNIRVFSLDDPHPESGFKALFGKIWYEGASEPRYDWQSTGGSDDFESKLSLMPLIFGTLKGTFYAMLFSVPVALLAALYTAEFLNKRLKQFIKPLIEIMASVPSVVLGFIAALWLAPRIEHHMPTIFTALLLIPSVGFLFGSFWHALEKRKISWVKPGFEFLVFMPVLLVMLWLSAQLGPAIERVLFSVTDPATGERIADFTRWWPQFIGGSFEQRNSLVVGFVMGFAVIPIIYTIAEDAFSNVPNGLRSASMAMGASRWQTAIRIIVPTASGGLFSAVMVGLGRAVGETMIVVMATGNTPVMEWNIFSGMRTLSANIAVELPEAPHGSTLYRTLFLGALVLFVMTFTFNTLADVLRHRLREKYKTV